MPPMTRNDAAKKGGKGGEKGSNSNKGKKRNSTPTPQPQTISGKEAELLVTGQFTGVTQTPHPSMEHTVSPDEGATFC